MLHYLILIPYYFFGALLVLATLILLCRVTRLKVAIHNLVGTAIVLSAVLLAAILATPQISIADFRALPMLVLGLASMLLALLDSLLRRALPLPLDEELHAL
jgi:membrane associated rhomboid family serine protease